MMKIAFVDSSVAFAGAERNLKNLIEHLDRREFEPIVIVPYPMKHHGHYANAGARIVARATRPRWWMGGYRWRSPIRGADLVCRFVFARLLEDALRRERPDVLHLNVLRSNSRQELAVAKRLRVATVGHLQSLWTQNPVCKSTIVQCDCIVAVSDAVAVQVRRAMESARSMRVERVYPGVCGMDTASSGACRSEALKRLGLRGERRYLASVAMLDPRKGHDTAIGVLAELATDFPEHTLLIAGGEYGNVESGERERLERLALRYGVRERVVFLGSVDDIWSVYAAADAVLALSHDGEAFGFVAAESARMAKVAVGTALGATPELIVDCITGILVPPADAPATAERLRALLSAPERRSRMGAAARSRAEERWDPRGCAREMERVYRSLVVPSYAEGKLELEDARRTNASER